MRTLVGVDAGASSTRVAVANAETLEIIARHAGPAGAVVPTRVDEAAIAIADTVRAALVPSGAGDVALMVVGAAGTGRPTERDSVRDRLRALLPFPIHVETDAAIAYRAGFGSSPGVLLIVGTGAIALARDSAGGFHQVGGYGSVFADEIGGYNLARGALAAVAQGHDGRGPETTLRDAILAVAEADSFDALVSWANSASHDAIAAIGAVVLETADSGDAVAVALVEAAATHLTAYVARAIELSQSEKPTIVMSGGLVSPHSPLWTAITNVIEAQISDAIVATHAVDPVRGALELARDLL